MAFVDTLYFASPGYFAKMKESYTQHSTTEHSVCQPFIIVVLWQHFHNLQFGLCEIWVEWNGNSVCARWICVLFRPWRVTKIAHIIYVSLAFRLFICLFFFPSFCVFHFQRFDSMELARPTSNCALYVSCKNVFRIVYCILIHIHRICSIHSSLSIQSMNCKTTGAIRMFYLVFA